MSNDPSIPNDPDKITGKTSKQVNETTEVDLWDLDSDDSEFVLSGESSPSGLAGLPARRKVGSPYLQSKKPTEKHINIPTVEEIHIEQKTIPESTHESGLTVEPPQENGTKPEETGDNTKTTVEGEIITDSKPALPSITSMNKMEKIAISCLFAALALGAILTLIHFSSRVPTRPLVTQEIDYPVSGEIVEITRAITYWRSPVTTGENADVVRRGTQLIPVLKMSIGGKSGVIRVFFRNEDGIVIGDGITRAVKGEAEITVAATAGFEDVGMHTAYRTGDSLPWVVQVFEGPSANAPHEKFRKLLETEISTQIR